MVVTTPRHGPAALVDRNREEESETGCRGCRKIRDDEVYNHEKLKATSNGAANGVARQEAGSATAWMRAMTLIVQRLELPVQVGKVPENALLDTPLKHVAAELDGHQKVQGAIEPPLHSQRRAFSLCVHSRGTCIELNSTSRPCKHLQSP
ncbi:hypothetical protein GGTG_08718 [Gaeumannomyces tritici R3-111a-1]|uniref:Uncharacterized protein n=1 Tax=Gaeumannomyces tritici (strain R3-111a-1) TaxID=644352 RepID=J3P5C9_GAET3|nr:hypothetical protein GGTG_08718 [Gaeumannomyces tritici R3-111a-1]EJT74880.1 hypothetical protein GGTG_08718 [Gaeumannomyces tritici R3-111a-1]